MGTINRVHVNVSCIFAHPVVTYFHTIKTMEVSMAINTAKKRVILDLTEDQQVWLQKEATKRGMTLVGVLRYWCQKGHERNEKLEKE